MNNDLIEQKNKEINDLKNQLLNKDKTIELLNKQLKEKLDEIINLKNQLLNKDKTIESLNNEIKQKLDDINILKNKININDDLIGVLNPGEKVIATLFISADQTLIYSIACKTSTPFVKVEEKLYDEYPELKNTDNYFLHNGSRIKRFKTIEENNIKSGKPIILNKLN